MNFKRTHQPRRTMPLQLPPGTFRAYLFDCDGTIVDSMPLHYIAWKQALGEQGCTLDEDLFYSWGGKPPVEIIAALNQMRDLKMPTWASRAQPPPAWLPSVFRSPASAATEPAPSRLRKLEKQTVWSLLCL